MERPMRDEAMIPGVEAPARGDRGHEAPTADDKRLEAILHGPMVKTILTLGLPTLVVLVVQTFVGIAETWFVSFLGTDTLAGVALVFPVFMLMTMMSNGGIGGGVSSAVA